MSIRVDTRRVMHRFDRMNERTRGRDSVQVGYTAAYALRVHEDRNARHRVGKAGFLLDPFRQNAESYARIIRELMRQGATFESAALIAGLQLQRDSQLECPVRTGALRASAFTRAT